jgi:hypothetical protein
MLSKNSPCRILLLVWFIIPLMLCSCSGGSNDENHGVKPGVTTTRFITVVPAIRSGTAPLNMRCQLSIGLNETEYSLLAAVSKIEMDFGDNTGWLDVSQHYTQYWSSSNSTYDDSFIEHVFVSPGVYLIKARVTYKDGQVLESPAQYDELDEGAPRVRVSAPVS